MVYTNVKLLMLSEKASILLQKCEREDTPENTLKAVLPGFRDIEQFVRTHRARKELTLGLGKELTRAVHGISSESNDASTNLQYITNYLQYVITKAKEQIAS